MELSNTVSIEVEDYANMEEVDLVEKARSGDNQAFVDLYHQYRGKILAIVTSVLRSYPWRIDDVCSDVFFTMWSKLSSLEDATKFSSWIHTVTYNRCRSLLRQENRNPCVHVSTLNKKHTGCTLFNTLPDDRPTPLDVLQNEEKSVDLRNGIKKLKPVRRHTCELRAEGYKYDEIAAKQKISIGTVRSRLSKARDELKPLLVHLDSPQ